MNRNLIGTLSLVALSLLLNTTSTSAQALTKADVPFAFEVGSTQLPAGCYQVSSTLQSAVIIRNCDTSASALSVVRRESSRDDSAKLVFRHMGGQYFLAEIRSAGRTSMVVPASKAQKQILLANAKSSDQVMIALK